MPISAKIDPFDRDITVLINDALGPDAQSAALADFARGVEKDVEEQNKEALGYIPPHETVVDGSQGASEDSVKPNGTIVYEFDLIDDLFIFIDEMLIQNSPVRSGRYVKSHTFYADGVEFDPAAGQVPQASEFVIANTQPYARKIEGIGKSAGESPQFPDGVYEAVAVMARARFGNLAKIGFAYRSIVGGDVGAWAITAGAKRHARAHHRISHPELWLTRQPAIVITVR